MATDRGHNNRNPLSGAKTEKQFQPNEKASEKTLTDETLMETQALCAKHV